METVDRSTERDFAAALSRLCSDVAAVTIELRSGQIYAVVLAFHDGSTLVYEHWDSLVGAPSGHFGAVPIDDISRVVVH